MPVSPPVIGTDIRQWGRELNLFLSRNLGKLFFKVADDVPSENGIFLWDDQKNYPVVSAQNEFKQVAMKQTTPSSSVGAAGDSAGMIAWDGSYIYVCTATYDGSTAIWKRTALAAY
tara:strand:+ start:288 stop:635 length:348 start_codon:yes stop_codon:yes gene_type:complete